MKAKIHPKYYPKAKAHCACGASFEVGSSKEIIETEVCSQCHPFYTGQDKIIDTAGRVEKFRKRLAQKEALKAEAKAKGASKKKKEQKRKTILTK